MPLGGCETQSSKIRIVSSLSSRARLTLNYIHMYILVEHPQQERKKPIRSPIGREVSTGHKPRDVE